MAVLVKALSLFVLITTSMSIAAEVLVKDLTRIKGVRENSIVGYGLVTGLAGTGDSTRSQATVKSLSNAMQRFGLQITAEEVRSRNVAAVSLTATLPAYAQEGDQLDVTVSSLGDARSLVGGTLLMTELRGPDNKIYAVAQGALTVGGYKHELNGNVVQKNHPTSALIANGATIERDVMSDVFDSEGSAELILRTPDIETSFKVATAVNERFSDVVATPLNAANIRLEFSLKAPSERLRRLMTIEKLAIAPTSSAKVVINERTGTVVYGGNVMLSAISITHGEIKITIDNDTRVYMPTYQFGGSQNAEKVPDIAVEVYEPMASQATLPEGSSVTDLILALNKMNASSQDIISILQAIKGAGALHAEVLIQ